MSLASTLRSLRGRRLRDEDGHEHVIELLPPAGEAELALGAAVFMINHGATGRRAGDLERVAPPPQCVPKPAELFPRPA